MMKHRLPLNQLQKKTLETTIFVLKQDYGEELRETGWKKKDLFDGKKEFGWRIREDVPPILVLLSRGFRIVSVRTDLIGILAPNGVRMAKIKGGVMLSGKPLNRYLQEKNAHTKPESGIRNQE